MRELQEKKKKNVSKGRKCKERGIHVDKGMKKKTLGRNRKRK